MGEILLIEDDDDIRQDLAELLREEGFEVKTALHGAEALRWMREGARPRLILLDLMMPIMDGWQFRQEQLRDPQLSAVPVLLLSGAGEVAQHAADLQAAGYITKPIRFERLLGAIAACG